MPCTQKGCNDLEWNDRLTLLAKTRILRPPNHMLCYTSQKGICKATQSFGRHQFHFHFQAVNFIYIMVLYLFASNLLRAEAVVDGKRVGGSVAPVEAAELLAQSS